MKNPPNNLSPQQLFAGSVDRAEVERDSQGNWCLQLDGWFLYTLEPPVITQFGAAGCEMRIVRPVERPDIAELFPSSPHARYCGYQLRLPLLKKPKDNVQIFFQLTLADGHLLTGSLDIKTTLGSRHSLFDHESVPSDQQPSLYCPAETLRANYSLTLTEEEIWLAQDHCRTSKRAEPSQLSVISYADESTEQIYSLLSSLSALDEVTAETFVQTRNPSERVQNTLAEVNTVRIRESAEAGRPELSFFNELEGEFLAFIDPTLAFSEESLSSAINCLKSNPEVGAVIGRILRQDGRIESAGDLIFREGETASYARGQLGHSPETNFKRPTDFSGNTFLLTRRELFTQLGGFDTLFLSRYWADADYCLRVALAEKKVVYEPEATFYRKGGAPPAELSGERNLLSIDRAFFAEKHQETLSQRAQAEEDASFSLQARSQNKKKALILSSLLSKKDCEENDITVTELVENFESLGFEVSTYLANQRYNKELPKTVEQFHSCSIDQITSFVSDRSEHYDAIWVSDYTALRFLLSCSSEFGKDTRVIFQDNFRPTEREKIFTEGQNNALYSSASVKDIEGQVDAIVQSNDELQAQLEEILQAPVKRAKKASHGLSETATNSYRLNNHIRELVGAGLKRPIVSREIETVDIIVPVYNNCELLKKCISSVYQNSELPFNLFIVDDASEEEELREYTRELPHSDGCENLQELEIIRNEKNLGFAGSVNLAIARSKGHVVLLNSDTEVPANWLSRLLQPLLEDDRVGSVTPFTNATTITAFPLPNEKNPLPLELPLEVIDDAFQKFAPRTAIDLPTGIGFCMLLNRKTLDEIGLFDSAVFERVYGEENDWCCRAALAGYRNVLAPNLFVLHHDGASVATLPTEERKHHGSKNADRLEALHPDYFPLAKQFSDSNPIAPIRSLVSSLIRARAISSEGVLIVSSPQLKGGSLAALDQIAQHLYPEKRHYLLYLDQDSFSFVDSSIPEALAISFPLSDWQGDFFEKLISFFGIKEVFINQLAGADFSGFLNKLEQLELPYSYFIHDYFSACPNINLINEQGDYCKGEKQVERCAQCLAGTLLKGANSTVESNIARITAWRERFEKLLGAAEHLYAPSEEAIELINSYYPSIDIEPFNYSPSPELHNTFKREVIQEPLLRVAVVGAIGQHKGSDILYRLADLIEEHRLPVLLKVIGFTDRHPKAYQSKNGILEVLGEYQSKHISRILAEQNIAFGLLPSIWPETHMFTATELMASGYPLALFDIGAAAARVRRSGGGWLVSERSAEALLKLLEHLVMRRDEIIDRAKNLENYGGSLRTLSSQNPLGGGTISVSAERLPRKECVDLNLS